MDAAFKQGPGRVHRGGWRPRGPRICQPDLQPIADGSPCLVLYGSCVWEGKRPGTPGLEPRRARTRHARLQGLGSQTLVSRKLLASDRASTTITRVPQAQEATKCLTPMSSVIAFLGGGRVTALDIHMDVKMPTPNFRNVRQ